MRFTTDKPEGNLQNALNLFYIQDHQAYVRGGGPEPDFKDVSLYDFIRRIIKTHDLDIPAADDEELSEAAYERLFDGTDTMEGVVALLYTAAWAFAEIRGKLASYEDAGLTPKEVKEMCENVDTRMLQWFDHKYGIGAGQMMHLAEADKEGRLWVAPCKLGTTLYMIVTKRPKLNWPEFSFIKTTCLTEHNFFRVIRDFGKTVFLTRKEANDALAKVKEDHS